MIKFHNTTAEIYIPDNASLLEAVARTTHLGIGAHQDDLEFMAPHGIIECYERDDRWFGGITCTDGGGSARTGPYASTTDEEMKAIRVQEQNTAADIGKYSFMAQLAHPSSATKKLDTRGVVADDIEAILKVAQPEFIYAHNPFDKHPTHLGVFLAMLDALRRLPKAERPKQLIACEGWRNLDWFFDDRKLVLPLMKHKELTLRLNSVFQSQIAGGKNYAIAIEGRRTANATYYNPHTVDAMDRASYAVDLTLLLEDDSIAVEDYVAGVADEFKKLMVDSIKELL